MAPQAVDFGFVFLESTLRSLKRPRFLGKSRIEREVIGEILLQVGTQLLGFGLEISRAGAALFGRGPAPCPVRCVRRPACRGAAENRRKGRRSPCTCLIRCRKLLEIGPRVSISDFSSASCFFCRLDDLQALGALLDARHLETSAWRSVTTPSWAAESFAGPCRTAPPHRPRRRAGCRFRSMSLEIVV